MRTTLYGQYLLSLQAEPESVVAVQIVCEDELYQLTR
jgi:hypothetical protein